MSLLRDNPVTYINNINEAVRCNLNSIKSLNLDINDRFIKDPYMASKEFIEVTNFAIRLTPRFAFDNEPPDNEPSKQITISINAPTGVEHDVLDIVDDEEEMISKITLYLLIKLYKVDVQKELKKSIEHVIRLYHRFLSLHESAYSDMEFIHYKYIDDSYKPLELNQFNLNFHYEHIVDINSLKLTYDVILNIATNKQNTYVTNDYTLTVASHSITFNLLTIFNHEEDYITFGWLIDILYGTVENYLNMHNSATRAIKNVDKGEI